MSDLSPDPQLTPPALCDARRQALFCDSLAQTGNVRLACCAALISPQTAYRTRRALPGFRQCWDAALVLARAEVEAVLAERALNGVEEPVFYHGEEIARRRRYDSRLLLAHLARLDALAEQAELRARAEDFDAALAALERGEALPALVLPEPEVTPEAEEVPVVEAALRWLEARESAAEAGLPDAADGDDGDEGLALLTAARDWLVAQSGEAIWLAEAGEEISPHNPVPGVPRIDIAAENRAPLAVPRRQGRAQKNPGALAERRGQGGCPQ